MPSAIDTSKPIGGSSPGPTTASVRQNFAIAASEISAMQAPADGTSYAQQDSGVTNFPTFLNLVLKHNTLAPPLPTPPHVPTDMRIAPADGTAAAILMDSWGTTGTTTSILSFRHAGGAASSPGQSVLNAGLGRIEMIGHDTAAYGGSGATITAFAGEPWTPSGHGTYVNFATMGIGQTGGTVRMQIGTTGGIVIGTPTGTGPIAGGIGSDMGPGTINASAGFYVNGALVTGGPGSGMSGPIVFSAPLTGGTITSSGTVGLAIGAGLSVSGGALVATGTSLVIPTANLLGGTGAALTGVSVGSGLNLNLGVLTATGTSLVIPNANILSGNGAALGGITLGANLSFSGSFPNQTLNAAGGSSGPTTLTGDVTGTGTGTVATTTVGLRGALISTTPPLNTQVLAFNSATGHWEPTPPSVGTSTGTVANSAVGNLLTWYSSPGTTVNPLPTISATAAGSLTINQNTSAPAPAPFLAGTLLQMVGADAPQTPNFEMTGFGGSPGFVGRRAGGTNLTPANTPAATSLLAFTARGWDSTNLWMPASSTGANLLFQTAEAWGPAAHGTNISFSTTPIGQLVSSPQIIIGPNAGIAGSTGGLTVGAPTAPASPLVTGDLNVAGRILQNGTPIGGTAETYLAIQAVGTTQGAATALSADFCEVTTQLSGGTGVILPIGSACLKRKVRNSLAGVTIQIYPPSGGQINTQGVNAPFPLLPNSTGYFEYGGAKWFSIP